MVSDLDDTLAAMLAAEMARIPGCPIVRRDQISFLSPAAAAEQKQTSPSVNLYLHDLRENLQLREESFRVTRPPGDTTAQIQRSPVKLDLTYRVTAHAGSDSAMEHRLISDLLTALLRYRVIPEEYRQGVLNGGDAPLLSVAQPEHAATSDPAQLWRAIGGPLKPSVSLVVTVAFNPFETRWTRVVREAVVGIGPGLVPQKPLQETSVRVSCAGVVTAQADETPLPGVTVRLEGLERTAITDDKGFFYFLDLVPGKHAVTVGHEGYEPARAEFVAPPAGKSDQLQPLVIALLNPGQRVK